LPSWLGRQIQWPPSNTTIPHIHELEDEGVFILQGSLTIKIGSPGWAPRNHWHDVTVGPEGDHVLLIQTPGSQLSAYLRIIGSQIQVDSPGGLRARERMVASELWTEVLEPRGRLV
jgi:hypothetical protein